VDGNDVTATAGAMCDDVASVRAGRGPVVVEAATHRWPGRYEGDPERSVGRLASPGAGPHRSARMT
jgi:TPP-dependent pyruvate/acetoin dehydrogenase alpha subunit